ncbi:MAG: cohesin domain-containing protein [Candidatus Paceibacterota bacterium]|jgi:hypothetical protein
MKDKNNKRNTWKFIEIHRNVLLFFVFILAFYIIKPISINAAELYLETSQPEYSPNETFSVDIRLNVAPSENINAVEVYLSFDKGILETVDFSTANSILTFIKNPVIDQQKGLINFSGIIPGGYTGRLTGDPGKSNLLGKAIFQVKKQEKETILINFLTNSQVLLNDGQGTKIALTLTPLEIKIKKQEVVFNPLNDWEKIKEEDKIPPEEFTPEIMQMENQYFLVFNTQDKQSGIDSYAVYESARKKEIIRIDTKDWIVAESPYLLKDQNLKSYIYVKAVDKAGNERIKILNPQVQIKWYKNYLIWSIIILGIIIGYIFYKLNSKFYRR